MESEEYDLLYKFEENNWWYKAKRRLIFGYVGKPQSILDVGCGTGIISSKLDKIGITHSVDYSKDALKFCEKRGLSNVTQGSVTDLPFQDESFDLVGCFDVLYHRAVSNEKKAIEELYRVCKKGGKLIFTDSAMKCLWSKHDIVQYARARYSQEEVKQKLEEAGFKIEKLSYFFFFIFPLVYLARRWDNKFNKDPHPKVNVYNTNEAINFLLDKLMYLEYLLIKLFNLPFGSSIFCVARKE